MLEPQGYCTGPEGDLKDRWYLASTGSGQATLLQGQRMVPDQVLFSSAAIVTATAVLG